MDVTKCILTEVKGKTMYFISDQCIQGLQSEYDLTNKQLKNMADVKLVDRKTVWTIVLQ